PLHQRVQMHSRIQFIGSAGAGMTLSTPTSVCIPLNSQRTSSQITALCRSGRIKSASMTNCSDHSAHQQYQYSDAEYDSVKSKRDKSSCSHPMHKHANTSQRYEKGNHKSNRQNDPFMAIHCEWHEVHFVTRGHHRLHEII